MIKTLYAFYKEYILNHIVSAIPSQRIRNWFYRFAYRIKIGNASNIMMSCYIYNSNKDLVIGANSVINQRCVLDRRGGLFIGDNVSISPGVSIYTAGHYPDAADFACFIKEVRIHDYVWIGANAMIMPGVVIGKGAVVLPGSVVIKSIKEFEIVGGVPSRLVRVRNSSLQYNPAWLPLFM